MSHYLGYPPGAAKPVEATNHRNGGSGSSGKTVLTDDGSLHIEVPHDRHDSFEPQLIGKHEQRFTGFDEKNVATYAHGMTVRALVHRFAPEKDRNMTNVVSYGSNIL